MNEKIPEALAVLDIEIAFQIGKSRDERDIPTALIKARAAFATEHEALKLARKEFDGLPHSLGYEFTHIPKIDAAIAAVEKLS